MNCLGSTLHRLNCGGRTKSVSATAKYRRPTISAPFAKNQPAPTNAFLDRCAPECDNGVQRTELANALRFSWGTSHGQWTSGTKHAPTANGQANPPSG